MGASETTQNMLGPFWRMNAPPVPNGGSYPALGDPRRADDRHLPLRRPGSAPGGGAEVDIWHSSPVGLYESQNPEQADFNLRGKFTTDAAGYIRFDSIRPAGYPIPTDAVVGRLLAAQNRHPYRPAHIHALAFKPGFKTLITQIYADDDPRLASDVQFGVTRATTGTFVRHDEAHPRTGAAPWISLDHVLVMEPGEARLPKPPIR